MSVACLTCRNHLRNRDNIPTEYGAFQFFAAFKRSLDHGSQCGYLLSQVKHQYRIAPALATLDVKKNNFPLLLDGTKDNSIPETNDTISPTSPVLDGINCPSKEGKNDKIVASLLLNGEKPDCRIAKKNHREVLTRADIDEELRKMMCMTPEEAAYVAAQAVKEAEAAVAEAEQATKEAEDAEREADAARAFAEASSLALKRRKIRW